MIKHLGVIADGNRRWAKEQGLPTIEGHKQGLKAIEKLVDGAAGFMFLVRKTGIEAKPKFRIL